MVSLSKKRSLHRSKKRSLRRSTKRSLRRSTKRKSVQKRRSMKRSVQKRRSTKRSLRRSAKRSGTHRGGSPQQIISLAKDGKLDMLKQMHKDNSISRNDLEQTINYKFIDYFPFNALEVAVIEGKTDVAKWLVANYPPRRFGFINVIVWCHLSGKPERTKIIVQLFPDQMFTRGVIDDIVSQISRSERRFYGKQKNSDEKTYKNVAKYLKTK